MKQHKSDKARLLLAVDFSRPARRAIPYAIKLASVLDLGLTAVHVVKAPPGFGSSGRGTRRSLHPLTTKALLDLGRLVRLAAESGVTADHKLLVGIPEEAILQVADEVGAVLIALGTHGRSGLDRFRLGSVAESVLRRAHCPVLAINAQAGSQPPVNPLRLHLTRLLVATDFSASSTAALRCASAMARLMDGHVTVVHVTKETDSLPRHSDRMDQVAHKRADHKLQHAVAAAGIRESASDSTLLQGEPAELILAHAARTKAHLIVMGSQGRRGMERLMLGSVAESVLRKARCPVLVVKRDGRINRLVGSSPSAAHHR
ncbi:MAG TPA: universal stress protein [Nitrospiraceae bacterium]|nr:universal stress protein [Nitrospiraceae bacterium]